MKMKNEFYLLLAALIWGGAFVAQSVGMNYIGPWTFNCVRNLIGAVTLYTVITFFREKHEKHNSRETIVGGILCGIVLMIAGNLQQIGIQYTTVGKAGFITALYVVIVPCFAMLFGKKTTLQVWFCILVALIGFYLLSGNQDASVTYGDILILICAFFYAIHILVIDYYVPKADPVQMSCIQFFVAGILSLGPSLLFEHPSFSSILDARYPLLYAGVLSSGVAYTFQMIGQKNADPTIATLLLSLESVFSALLGFLILNQRLSFQEIIGCILIFIATIFSQIPMKRIPLETS